MEPGLPRRRDGGGDGRGAQGLVRQLRVGRARKSGRAHRRRLVPRGAPAQTDGRRGARAVPAARAVDLHGLFRGATKCDESLRLGPEPEEEWPREQRADSASRSSRFDLQRRSMASGSPVDGRRSSPRTTYSGAPSRAGPRRSGMSSVRTGRGAAAAAASAGGASITTTRCVDGRGSVRKFCTGNKYLI